MMGKILIEDNLYQAINDSVEIALDPIAFVNEKLIQRTISRAKLAPRKRARVLLHPNQEDSLHEMLIALPEESCDVPHINFKSGKSFHIVEGEMTLMIFSNDGTSVTAIRMKANDAIYNRIVRLNKPFWHTIIPLSEYAVFIETINGPFTGNQFAPWCKDQVNGTNWIHFVEDLRQIAKAETSVQSNIVIRGFESVCD